ncbi:DNA adenine methylase [Veillonella magna]|uniref:DNA adenine methylase n=1 Tax=Veillonella magna TaxID=464322 RepID=UPI0023F40457|nr:DNA adenine methylase [Veillonella magna]
MNPSPLRYPGGKYKLYQYVAELIRLNNCVTYAEPFCGGAAVALELLMQGDVKDIIINDYDYTIFCFWESMLNETEKFIELILNTDVSIKEWWRQKNIRENIDRYSRLEIGFSTFFLNRTNRSGIIDKAGPIGGYKQQSAYDISCRFNKSKLIERIEKIASLRNHIYIHNLEALDFIDNIILKKRKIFTFFDPPYYGKGPGLYTNFYCHGDHKNLSNVILHQMGKRKWIVTYDNVDEIKNMYHRCSRIEFGLRYTLQEKKSGSEIMFFSRNIKRPERETEYLTIL